MGLFGSLKDIATGKSLGNFIDDITGKTSVEAGDLGASQYSKAGTASVNTQLQNAYLGNQQTLNARILAETLLTGVAPEQTSAYLTNVELYNKLPTTIKTQITAPTAPTGGMFDAFKTGGIQGILQNQPGYQAGLQKQQELVENQGSAYGKLLSSQNLKNLNQSAQNYATTQYGNLINNLGGINNASNVGANIQNAGIGVANQQYQTGSDVANALMGGLLGRIGASQNLLKTFSSIGGAMAGGAGGAAGGASNAIAYI